MNTEEKNMESLIMEAAERLFLEQGFVKTTTGQIAREARCNQALVHYYYRTKDNLFDKIFEEKVCFMLANMMAIHSGGMSFEQKIVHMIGLHFDFLRQNPRLVSFIFSEATSNSEHLAALVDKMRHYPRQFLGQLELEWQREVDNRTYRPIPFADLILSIISLNVMPFLMRPIFQQVLCLSDEQYDQALEKRKQENIDTILARLKR